MNKARLLKLADLLEADAKNKKGIKFDLGLWGAEIKAKDDATPKQIVASCGTTACAVGLACLSPTFNRQGLRADIVSKNDGKGNNIVPTYGYYRDWEAVQQFFDVDRDGARFLFASYLYDGPVKGARGERAVAKRVRDFVAGMVAPER